MFIDALDPNKEYDIAIIGSGPAGLSLALRLQAQTAGKASILIVESGKMTIDGRINMLSQVNASGDLAGAIYQGHAQRAFGGSSTVWSGYCTTLEARSFLAEKWPFSYAEIESYYQDAADILDLPPEAYQSPSQPLGDDDQIIYKPFYRSPPTRFHEKYRDYFGEQQNIEVLLNRTCTRLQRQGGRVEAAVLQNSDTASSPEQFLKAKQFVLSCGGIGNPRLLQLSGISPESPIGYYFMQHPHIYGSGVVHLDKVALDAVMPRNSDLRIVHALQFSNTFCLQNNLLNFSVAFETSSVEKRNLLGKKREVYVSSISIRAEMPPLEYNRVYLGEERDYLNQPAARVDFRFDYGQLGRDSWLAFAKALLAEGIGRATIPPEGETIRIETGGHFIGTTRMGHTAQESVADKNCKVHTMENLFLAGSSIFPASAAANPTYSIVAFALRLADHLAEITNYG